MYVCGGNRPALLIPNPYPPFYATVPLHGMECTHTETVTDLERGEVICSTCGEVISDSLPAQSTPIVTYDRGLSATMGINRDSAGRELSPKSKHDFNRMRKWDSRSKMDAKMLKPLTLLHTVKGKLGIPDHVVEWAATIYRQAADKKITVGRTVASAALYIACRESGITRTVSDIITVSNTKEKVVYRTYKQIVARLDIRIQQCDPAPYVTRICNTMNLPEKTKRRAINILYHAHDSRITAGRSQVGMAAASIYLAACETGINITQGELAESAGVTAATVRSRIRDILEMFPDLQHLMCRRRR